ncbi:hypothetical protein DUNSADRAFT_6566 [Dunaliella salina]|uniref:ABM domain-containing protein n=1 Tax=Dunaliella salina TaxID=3046 RepID=A0ABQ7GN11_DUNSA|nr:hypothetical protein DUNSADRAFT_6566 [Dunaliella salina]|eukprot:KAF5835996.1 hypothetical protein DUNSADRAFT_6566 [Dunaliella salina]
MSFVLLSAVLLVGAFASRLPPSNILAEIQSETFPAGLKHVHKPLQAIRDNMKKEREDWTEKTAYAFIKFIVPPSQSDDFEEAWLRLESEVRDKEDDNNIFSLKSSALDNLFYYSYGEWESVDSLVSHLQSNHFQDFAEDERNMAKVSRERREEEDEKRAYIVVDYFVPPGECEDFVEKWKEEAKSTIKDEGNRVLTLSHNMNDNVRFYAYSSWDSLEDYKEHTESEHHGALQDFLEDRDIVKCVKILEPVTSKSRRRQMRNN